MKKIIFPFCLLLLLYANGFSACMFFDFSNLKLYPDEYTGYFYIDFGLKQEILGDVTTGGTGFSLDMGFNLARFFHKAVIFGPFCGIAPMWGTKYSEEFLSDYRKNYHVPDASSDDALSIDAAEYQGQFVKNGEIMGSGFSFNYGLIIKFPHKYAPPVKIYKSFYWSNTKEISGSTTLYYSDGSSSTAPKIYSLDRTGWGIEIILFRGYSLSEGESWLGSVNLGYVSLFLEFMDFSKTELYSNDNDYPEMRDVYLSEFMDDDFNNKYGTEFKMGLKIGINVL